MSDSLDNGDPVNSGAVSSQPSETSKEVKDLLGDKEDNAGGDTSDSSNSSDKNTIGKNTTQFVSEEEENKLRTRLGQERKVFLSALAQSSPEALANLIESDTEVRRLAGKLGFTLESLRSTNQNASVEQVPEEFVKNALYKNLNKADAEAAWKLTATLKQSGLSEELAQKTALEQVASGGSNSAVPASIPAGGAPAGGNQDVSQMVSATAFTKMDHTQRAQYRAKHGNKFTD